jgi:hypothetical protein
MAARSALTPQSRLGLPHKSTKPNDPVSPKSGNPQPQGRKYKPSNQWATPPLPQHALERIVYNTTELFASPLNSSMELGITYCSAFLKDGVLWVLYNTFSYRWTRFCAANLEYERDDTRKAILHVLASSTDTTNPFLAVLDLPIWEDTSLTSAAIRSYPNTETSIQITSGHVRFVPTHKQSEGNADTLTPVK